ncbi:DUF3299 domain-containing protein [Rhodovulum sp. DZ06]|uniref:DUF3299 domain-containing protein n=1 Tax=Rhodovulum sp. DZ06 TaxID=3425126 RepID=UPI003D34D782
MIARPLAAAAFALLALPALAAEPRETWFEDLVPEGVAPAEIIGMGEINAGADTWKPEYDENAVRYNVALDGALIRMPGYIVPLAGDAEGVTSFLLVPYVGACIHVPPPPPNQIVFVSTPEPWRNDLWDPVWVTGTLRIQSLSTDLAEVGYALEATGIERYTEE